MQVLAQPTYDLSTTSFRMAPLLPKGYPDNNVLFNFRAQTSMPQEDDQRRILRTNDMGEPIDIITKGYRRFKVTLSFNFIQDDVLAKIMQFYYSPSKGAEGLKDFAWEHPTEINPTSGLPQKYVAKFDTSRMIASTIFNHEKRDVRNINLIVMGWME